MRLLIQNQTYLKDNTKKLLENHIFGVCGFAAHPKNAISSEFSGRYERILSFISDVLGILGSILGTGTNCGSSLDSPE